MISICFCIKPIAQAPQAIPFQATARNANGVLLPNKTVSLRFTIHDATTYGTTVYQETQSVITNAQGLFLTNIGQGNVVSGVSLATINWSVNSKFIQIEMDTTNTGKVYRDIGTQQMLSVPYALSARRADSCNNAINAVSANNGIPVGTVIANASNNIPLGWLICNGKAVNRKAYNALFASIGTTYGLADGIDSFNVPDYRGMFLRGMDLGAGNDPDTASRVALSKSTMITGGSVGTVQLDGFQGHFHKVRIGSRTGSYYATGTSIPHDFSNIDCPQIIGMQAGEVMNDGVNGTPRTSSETRPKNVYVNYIIKY